MKRVLLLNADWSPLRFITDARAIVLMYNEKAEQIAAWDEVIRSPSKTIQLPATIRLFKYVPRKWRAPRFKRRALFNRDGWTCQYCGEKLVRDTITIDHIKPKSAGGLTSWLNCVTACGRCNKKKADLTPEQAGMKLLRRPTMPQSYHFWNIILGSDDFHEEWTQFFPH